MPSFFIKGQKVFVDKRDFAEVTRYKWSLEKGANTYYLVRKKGPRGKVKRIVLHRLLTNAPKGTQVDHKNGNGLDNRRKNLRICKQQHNLWNQGKRLNRTSKYKGVSWCKAAKKWQVHITVNYKNIYLGLFKCEKEAAKKYNKAAKKFFGQFARSNKI